MDELKQIWGKTQDLLEVKLGKEEYGLWIKGISPISRNGKNIVLGTNEFLANWITDGELYQQILDAMVEASGQKDLTLKLEGGHELAVEEKPKRKKVAKKTAKPVAEKEVDAITALKSSSTLNPTYLFDNFVVGDSNKFCHAACLAIAKAPGTDFNPLFIHGGVGLGKTHIAQAIAHEVKRNNPKAKVECLSSEDFLNVYVEAMSKRKESKFRRHFRNLDILVIDDVQFFKGKEKFQEEFFHTFNTLYNGHKQIVLTSDKPPHELDGLEGRLVSRFEWGVTTEVSIPELETRAAILKQKINNYKTKVDVPNEVIFYLAERIKNNIRRLEGAMMKVISYVSLTNEKVTRELADKLLGSIFEEESGSDVTVETIIKATADTFDLRVSDITGKKRQASIARARQLAMFLSRKMTNLSTPEIGDLFGRSHATILHAVQKVNKDMSADEEFKLLANRLERQLNGL